MAVKIEFDTTNNVQPPTLVLSTKSGEKIGVIPAYDITFSDNLNSYSEISFKVGKPNAKEQISLWEQIKDFKLVWCKEWDLWFEIYVDIDESNNLIKNISGKSLGEAELSQIMLYDIEVNTEKDISREDYINPTLLYNIENHKESLLHRITEKARHYEITHVDSTIAKLQRSFSFNGISIYDAFQEISEEIGCLFIFPSCSDSNGKISRTIEIYDLESNCHSCNYRGEFTKICPKCGSNDISEGYGNDTSIFISSENLAKDIRFTTDVGSVKNCFKLEAGDDLMTATIRGCNPNGTDYIWRISDATKEDMPKELADKINQYDELYQYYQNEYSLNLSGVSDYNVLVNKYKQYNENLQIIQTPIIGYSNLMLAYYNTIDFGIYLQSELLPNANMSDTTAEKEAAKLTRDNLSPVSVSDLELISLTSANSAVLSMAKILVDARYQVKIVNSTYSYNETTSTGQWTGSFRVQNNSNAEDAVTTENIIVLINTDYEQFVQQKIQKSLNKENIEDISMTALFKREYDDFCAELKKYALDYLNFILDCAQTCIDVLIEQGVGDKETWTGRSPNLYNDLYIPYREKLDAIQSEISLRESEILTILGEKDNDGNIINNGLQTLIINARNNIQNELDFESYLGTDLWNIFSSYRREDKFQNSNYISEGLNNAELFNRALEFIEIANKEIYKSSELQHSISAELNNLLVIKEFKPLTEHFEVGNWLRIKVNNELYKLRLIGYEINFEDIENITVTFSDVIHITDGVSDLQSILSQAGSMATSYETVQRQATAGANSNELLNNWVEKGLEITSKIMNGTENQTQTWDSHGMLFRQYDSVTDDYYNTQLKIINSTLAITTDNWETVRTAVGNYYYYDPKTSKLKSAYGVNAETLVGKLILGEELGIYNNSGSLTFDEDGLEITNQVNTFRVNPNSSTLFSISTNDEKIFYLDEEGMLHISGDGAGLDITANSAIFDLSQKYTDFSISLDGIKSTVKTLSNRLTDGSMNYVINPKNFTDLNGWSLFYGNDWSMTCENNKIKLIRNTSTGSTPYIIARLSSDLLLKPNGQNCANVTIKLKSNKNCRVSLIRRRSIGENSPTLGIVYSSDIVASNTSNGNIYLKANEDTIIYAQIKNATSEMVYYSGIGIYAPAETSEDTGCPVGTVIEIEYVQFTDTNTTDERMSSIEQTADSIVANVSAKFENYSTTEETNTAILSAKTELESTISQTVDDITLSVNKKVSYDELSSGKHSDSSGTSLSLNSEMVRVSWNNITKYIQFEDGEIRIYDDLSTPQLLCSFTNTGNWYYYRGITIGKVGTSAWVNYPQYRGLSFLLDNHASYMGWGYQETVGGNYTMYLVYHANDYMYKKGLHFSGNVYNDGKLYLGDYLRTVRYSDSSGNIYGGLMDETCPISLTSPSIQLRTTPSGGGSVSVMLQVTGSEITLYNTSSSLVQCYNNIQMNGYQVLGTSDARLKTNILDSDINATDILNDIEIKKFDWIDSGEHNEAGMIAQQLQSVLPNLVHKDSETGKLSISFIELIPYLVKGIQELNLKLNQMQPQSQGLSPKMSVYSIENKENLSKDKWVDNYTLEEKKQFVEKTKPIMPEEPKEYESEPIIIPNN